MLRLWSGSVSTNKLLITTNEAQNSPDLCSNITNGVTLRNVETLIFMCQPAGQCSRQSV